MIRFGVAGHGQSYLDTKGSTLDSAIWYKARGIDLLEYSFGRGVHLTAETATSIGEAFAKQGVGLSVHAPYFVNLSNPDPEMIEKSFGYILQSAQKALQLGADRVVVHPATQGKLTRDEALALLLNNAETLRAKLDAARLQDVKICWETMGKQMQMGTVDEIIRLCTLDARYFPCIDFGHINAREQGILKSAENYNSIIQKMQDHLPENKVREMHVHFSKIQYGPKGEIRHLTFEDDQYGPEFEPLAEVLLRHALEPTVICESAGTQAEDCMAMKQTYFNLLNQA